MAEPLDKIYELLRNELTYEATLIAHRTNWFMASQAFFFTSLASALDRTEGVPLTLRGSLLFPLVPVAALIVCAVIFISVLSAVISTDNIRAEIQKIASQTPLV